MCRIGYTQVTHTHDHQDWHSTSSKCTLYLGLLTGCIMKFTQISWEMANNIEKRCQSGHIVSCVGQPIHSRILVWAGGDCGNCGWKLDGTNMLVIGCTEQLQANINLPDRLQWWKWPQEQVYVWSTGKLNKEGEDKTNQTYFSQELANVRIS